MNAVSGWTHTCSRSCKGRRGDGWLRSVDQVVSLLSLFDTRIKLPVCAAAAAAAAAAAGHSCAAGVQPDREGGGAAVQLASCC
jgi:uncharacterized membrane protein